MTSHVIAYGSLEMLFGTHTFHFNCFFEDFNCVFMQICCLSRVLLERKKNEQIKGLISNMWLFLVTNFRIASQVAAEKSLTEKKFTNRQTNTQRNTVTETTKTIYPYILHTGGITSYWSIARDTEVPNWLSTAVTTQTQYAS